MSSGHGRRSRAGLAWALFVSALSAATAHAQPRVVCADPHDSELVARIRGQSRDLPLKLQFAVIDLPAAPSLAEFRRAAQAHAADFVVKLRVSGAGGQIVYVYDAERGRLRVRKAPPPARSERFSRSAAAETIALIVRGELSAALSAEDDVAEAIAPVLSTAPVESSAAASSTTEPTPTRAPEPAVKAAVVAQPDTRAGSSTVTSAVERGAGLGLVAWSISAGLRGTNAGARRNFLSPELALQLRFARIVLGLRAHTSLQSRVRSDDLSVQLRQHALALEVLSRSVLGQRLELDLGVSGGAVIYRRTSVSDDASRWQIESPHSAWSPELSAVAALRWAFAQHFGVSVRVGLDLVLRPLRFVTGSVADPLVGAEVSHLRALAPWAGVCLFLDL